MKTIYIGKGTDNDYVANDSTVSRKHASITVTDDGRIVLKDLNSTNGTFVNGKRIQSEVVLQPNDVVLLGRYNLDWKSVASSSNGGHTRRVAAYNPNKKVIGRANTCDVCLPYEDVSSEHAFLEKLSSGEIAITDNRSTNGTYVNGERISYKVLHSGDVVTISKGHVLEWEKLMPAAAAAGKKPAGKMNNLAYKIAAIVILVLAIGYGGYLMIFHERPLSPDQAYQRYNSAVCLLYGEYSYSISIDIEDKNLAHSALELIGVSPEASYSFDQDGSLKKGTSGYTGTGFFISEDGKMGTNLHIARPWLYENESQLLSQTIQQLFARYSTAYPILTSMIPHIKVTGHLDYLGVVPNGLPMKPGNLTECSFINASDDTEKDVAIVQTVTHQLPNGVHTYIDINAANTAPEAVAQGKKVYVIGFPLGVTVGKIKSSGDEDVLENQIQTGTITQNRGEIEFGHNAPTFGGASGSPVLDEYGHLVGVHHAGLAKLGAHGFNWAIKVEYLKEIYK